MFQIQPNQIPLSFYNTASRQKEVLVPLKDDHVRMYTCGPTVYNFAHIGNFRTYIFEDLLRRTMQFFGFQVTQVMNLTDVDDKTIRGAIAQNVSLDAFTKTYKDAFFEDLKTLHIAPVEHYPAATDYIPHMIQMIEVLLSKDYAYYGADGSVYYAIHKFPHYGCLSHLHMDDLQAGASERVMHDEYEKDHVADFVLWKSYEAVRDGNIYWESPFGKGRPGWHLECSAMAISLLGETIDIHVGGIDNMFPHHENEIAQSEAYSSQPFVKLWMHSEHLLVDNKKMSKSAGNFYTLRDLLQKGYTGTQIRYLLLQTHYKTPLNFTFQGLDSAKSALQRLNDFIHRLQKSFGSNQQNPHVKEICEKTFKRFAESLADDLNISAALASLFDFVREMNGLLDQHVVGTKDIAMALEMMHTLNTVLAIFNFEEELPVIPQIVEEAFEKRQQARTEKNWKLADELRGFILNEGYIIEDSPQGARLKKVESN
jgi:cysteinyl-tRNA synthetase